MVGIQLDLFPITVWFLAHGLSGGVVQLESLLLLLVHASCCQMCVNPGQADKDSF